MKDARGGPPNVLLIVPHDAGDYFGCYGRSVSTPHIDDLADGGVRFTNHFCTSPLCSPARGSLITGQYPHTNGLSGLVNLGWNLPDYNLTDAQRFNEAGYHTYLIGGQHEKAATADLGFDEVLEDAPCADGDIGRVVEAVQSALENRCATGSQGPFYVRLGTATAHRRGRIDPAVGYFDPPYGYAFARDQGVPEDCVDVFAQWRDTPRLREDLQGFTGEIRRLDDAVGALLAVLRACGFYENTIIAFVPDHGIDYPRGKATMYDLGLKTALILRGPGIAGNREIDSLTSHIDVLPTLLDYCGITWDASRVQGMSLRPVIESRRAYTREMVFAEQTGYPGQRMRCARSSRHKLIQNIDVGMRSSAAICGNFVIEGSEDHYTTDRPEVEFYDLEEDPVELVNIAGEAAHLKLQLELQSALDTWLRST